jgi:hypothetical protein
MKRKIFTGLAFLAIFTGSAYAQPRSELDRLDEKFKRIIGRAFPGWQYERGEPVWSGGNVLIQFWSTPHKVVKLVVVPFGSAAEAQDALSKSVRSDPKREKLTDIGDESYALGYASSNITFRKGKLLVYVSVSVEIGAAPEERMLSQEQRFALEQSERKKWSGEFAKLANRAADSP